MSRERVQRFRHEDMRQQETMAGRGNPVRFVLLSCLAFDTRKLAMDRDVPKPTQHELILNVSGASKDDGIGHFFDACAPIFNSALDDRANNSAYSVNLSGMPFGPLVMSKVLMTGGRFQYQRDTRLIATSGLDLIFVQIILEGSDLRLVNGQEIRSRPGDVFIADLTRSMRTMTEHCANFSFVLPRTAFGLRDAELDRLHDHVLPAGSVAARLILNHIHALWQGRSSIEETDIAGLTTATAGLIGGFVQKGGSSGEGDETAGSRYLQVCQHIEMNLADLTLDPDGLARRFGMSRAALYRLFSATDGVANYIRDRRLRLAFRKLVVEGPPRVSAVGFACGFANTSSFIRAFKTKYGLTPGEAIESSAQRSVSPIANARSSESAILRSWIELADRGGILT
jgi:AraC-like DNA-binding protein